ncbi:MAG: hypothetical protein Q4F05_06250 [bacterium]|nr:hypothetical protein [bacterium]
MNNKIKKVLGTVMIVGLVAGMTGCQLAKEETTENTITATAGIEDQDQLCGAYITLDENDLLGQDRIYATETKNSEEESEYEFEGLKGSVVFYMKHKGKGEEDSYVSNTVSGAALLNDVAFHVGVHDNENTNDKDEVSTTTNTTYELEATLRVVKNKKAIASMYPIYQQKDGKVYLLCDGGNRADIGGLEGDVGLTLNDTYKETENGKEKSNSTIVKITIRPVDEVQFVVVKEMDQKDHVLHTTTYKKNDFKEKTGKDNDTRYEEKKLKLQKNTEYLIVEEHVVDQEKKNIVNRSIVVYDSEEEENEILCDFANNNGIIDIRTINLLK